MKALTEMSAPVKRLCFRIKHSARVVFRSCEVPV